MSENDKTGRISYLITSDKIIRIGLDTKRKFSELYNDFSAVNALVYYSENQVGKKIVIQMYLYNFSVDEEGNYCITEIDRSRAANNIGLFLSKSDNRVNLPVVVNLSAKQQNLLLERLSKNFDYYPIELKIQIRKGKIRQGCLL